MKALFTKINDALNLFGNMGLRYTMFRIKHELLRRSGLIKKKFPVKPPFQQYITLEDWEKNSGKFFFKDKESLSFQRVPNAVLEERFTKLKEGKLLFFNSTEFNIGTDYDWITNPDSGYQYDVSRHWTEIPDYSKEAGDIKYVWEKSRFSYLYDIIRYDFHFNEDCSEFVFSEIISWINANPVNCGPNYRCSQETSLRVLNWTFALYYYRGSPSLTQEVFNQIQFAIYWQIEHVFQNIDFSRIAVRNNHAITETLTLYLAGLLYPQFPAAAKWKEKGKKWFEEEIAYQIYEDGTFLQFSMNYHRVVIQLLTWALTLADKNNETFNPVVYDRAEKSLHFLRTCMVDENGCLPNYGANDGALFFKLNDAAYRDYRPQLSALAVSLKTDLNLGVDAEDINWYGLQKENFGKWQPGFGVHSFNVGGYYIFRELDTLTFIRCGNHKDRPSQADNLHLDIWYKGENILPDSGSYKYNTDQETLNYFMGTASHNTVMLGNFDQMKKGSRFIWYHWTQAREASAQETESCYIFKGTISAFSYLSKNILHEREIIKDKNHARWEIKDRVINKPSYLSMKQLWRLPIKHSPVKWKSIDEKNKELSGKREKGYISELYGIKEESEMMVIETNNDTIKTEFEII